MTKRALCFGLLIALASPSVAAAPDGAVTRTTAKGAEPLVRCLADAEGRTAAAWWFVPRESGGGTFSDLGAPGVSSPYFMTVVERGEAREVRLEAPAVSRERLLAAIDRCA